MLLLWCRGCFVFSDVTWAPRKYKLVVCDIQKKIWLNFEFGFCLMVGLDLEDLFQAKSFYDKWSSNYLLTVHHNECCLSFSCDLCERSAQTRHCYRTGLIQFWNQTANQPRGKKGKGALKAYMLPDTCNKRNILQNQDCSQAERFCSLQVSRNLFKVIFKRRVEKKRS